MTIEPVFGDRRTSRALRQAARSWTRPLVACFVLNVSLALCTPFPAFGAHPLITEDTGTQGQGRFQLELTAELGHEEERALHEDGFDRAVVLTYGVLDNLDVLLTVPHTRNVVQEDGLRTTDEGLGDIGLDAKWRFFEKDGVSVAVKPGVRFPTGDEDKGLGAGEFNYSVFLVTSFENDPWGYHIHIGYVRNRNVLDERNAIHHTSLAVTYAVRSDWQLVADLGNFTTPNPDFDEDTTFLILGAIYSVTDDFDLDFGVKRGVSEPETDVTWLLGLAWRFGGSDT
jgi:hypothetical protein